ncbi:MAG: chitinase [Blastocatellia bacterium]|jgi:hypothetical protein|nr:chitinase [Blastocatellia bacterium]
MRICFTCSAYYADDSAPFCLVDGTPLVGVEPDNDKWREGSRRIKEKETALKKRKRARSWRLVLLSALTVFLATVVLSRSVEVVKVAPALFTISGQVKADNKFAGGIKITLEGEQTRLTVTDPDGHYAFSELKADRNYTVTPDLLKTSFDPPNRSFVKLAKSETADFSGKARFYKVVGRVTQADMPLAGITIKLAGSTNASTLTRADGSYDFTDLPAEGRYTVMPVAVKTKFTPPSFPVESLTHDELADFSSLPLYKISGRVLSAGVPLSDISVTVTGTVKRSIRTNTHGDYAFTDLPADGSYTVVPTGTDLTFAPRPFPKLSHDEKADFSADAVREVYQISGRVGHGPIPLSGVIVTLSGDRTGRCATDPEGFYVFPGLPARGTYTVTASGPQVNFGPRLIPKLLKNESVNFLFPLKAVQTPFHMAEQTSTPTKSSRPEPVRPRIENSNSPPKPRP